MFDILGGGILGSIFGGVFRMAPEVLKWLDKKNDRYRNETPLSGEHSKTSIQDIA